MPGRAFNFVPEFPFEGMLIPLEEIPALEETPILHRRWIWYGNAHPAAGCEVSIL